MNPVLIGLAVALLSVVLIDVRENVPASLLTFVCVWSLSTLVTYCIFKASP